MNAITLGSTIYPLADEARLKASQKTLSDVCYSVPKLEQSFLTSRVKDLQSIINKTHDQFSASSVKTQTSFELLDLADLKAEIEEIDTRKEWSASQRTSKRQLLTQQAQTYVDAALSKLAADAGILRQAIVRVNSLSQPPLTEQLQNISNELDYLKERHVAQSAELGKQELAIKEVTEALGLFKKWEKEDLFKKALPTEAEIELMIKQTTSPDLAELAKAAVKKIEEHLQVVTQTRRFADLAKARDQLRDEASKTQSQLDALGANIKRLQEHQIIYATVPSAWIAAADWGAEWSKVVAAYEGFAGLGLVEMSADAGHFDKVEQYFQRMQAYIASVACLP